MCNNTNKHSGGVSCSACNAVMLVLSCGGTNEPTHVNRDLSDHSKAHAQSSSWGQISGSLPEGSSISLLCVREQHRHWRDCAEVQARLSLRCSPMWYHFHVGWLEWKWILSDTDIVVWNKILWHSSKNNIMPKIIHVKPWHHCPHVGCSMSF